MNDTELDKYCQCLLANNPNLDCDALKMKMSFDVLNYMMGIDWTQKIIVPHDRPDNSDQIQRAIRFLRTNEFGFQAQERVSKLAIRLFNLQSILNLDKVIKLILDGNLEGGYGELEAGDFFFRRGITFSYVAPSGTKGMDYDIQIEHPLINCDVKHKIEENEASKEALERTLSHAKSQVPPDQKSLFFIKIPLNWVQNPDIQTIVNRVNGTFFPRSENLVGYILHWERPIENMPGRFVWEYRFEINKNQEVASRGIIEQIRHQGDLTDVFTRALQRNVPKCANYGI